MIDHDWALACSTIGGQALFRKRLDRVLAAVVGGGLFLLGLGELVARVGEPLSLFFWLPTLWGGAALVLVGSFRTGVPERLSQAMVLGGAVLGFLPSAWTLLMPVLIVTLVIRTFGARQQAALFDEQ